MAGHVRERESRGITEIIADRNPLVSPRELNIGQGITGSHAQAGTTDRLKKRAVDQSRPGALTRNFCQSTRPMTR